MTDDDRKSIQIRPPLEESMPDSPPDELSCDVVHSLSKEASYTRWVILAIYCRVVTLIAVVQMASKKMVFKAVKGFGGILRNHPIRAGVPILGAVLLLFIASIVDEIVWYLFLLFWYYILIDTGGHILTEIWGAVSQTLTIPFAGDVVAVPMIIGGVVLLVGVILVSIVNANNWVPQNAATISRLSTGDSGIQLRSGHNSLGVDLSSKFASHLSKDYSVDREVGRPLVGADGDDGEIDYKSGDDTTLVVGVVSARVKKLTWVHDDDRVPDKNDHLKPLARESEKVVENLAESLIDRIDAHRASDLDLAVDNRLVPSAGVRCFGEQPTATLQPIIAAVGQKREAKKAVKELGELYELAYSQLTPKGVDIVCSVDVTGDDPPAVVREQIASSPIPLGATFIRRRTGIVVDGKRAALVAPVVDTSRRASVDCVRPTDDPRSTPDDNLDGYRDESADDEVAEE